MKNTLLLLLVLLTASMTIDAQRNCASHEHMLNQLEQDPDMEQRMTDQEKITNKYLQNPTKLNGTIVTIPVVVHVVWKANIENISDAQIMSQLDVLNDDFRATNSDATNDWPQAADSEIEFCLATVDPDGNPTSGIQRRKTNKRSFGTNDAVKSYSSGGLDAWPADDYLNIWVCNISGGILGYAQFPGGPDATDGVVNDYAYFGTIGTATAPFDLGRTATHEVGHWLNLRHIWGDGGCSVDDFVDDTPLSDGANYGCATGHISCGSLDMVENYMDYSDDACMNLFTSGQSDRMDALFAAGGLRESLLSSNGCGDGTTDPETCSDGILNNGETEVDCGGPNCDPCGGGGETCSDGILNNGETEVDCGGPNCAPCEGGGTCDTPGGTYASNIKPKRATLNWGAVSSATSYNVQIDEAGQTNWNDFSTSNIKQTISGLSNGQSYDWRVQAVCGNDLSEWSAICNFTAGNSSSGDCAARLINEIRKDVTIYPNPAFETISITDVDHTTVTKVQVIGLNGKVMTTVSAEDAMRGISINALNPGMYLLKVNFVDDTYEIKRFVRIK